MDLEIDAEVEVGLEVYVEVDADVVVDLEVYIDIDVEVDVELEEIITLQVNFRNISQQSLEGNNFINK